MSRWITPKDTEKEKFDAAIYGVWKGENYGGIATYYALYRCITSLGLSALMIDPDLNRKKDSPVSHSEKFAQRHYEAITKDFFSYDLEQLNECCDTFIMGCDQVWNYEVSRAFGKSFYLDFADDDKKIMSYASSFGHPISFTPSAEAQEIEELFHRFDFLSVRETGAVSVLKNEFGADSTRVLDPVFLAGAEVFDEIAAESSKKEEEKYLVSYILDPTPQIREALQYAAKKLNLKLVNMLDGIRAKFQKNKEALNLENTVENLETEDWLYYFKHSEFVITDSCHGASFAIVFEKPFVCIGNRKRGLDRFDSLMQLFQTQERYVLDPEKIMEDPKLLEPLDYQNIRTIMAQERERSWKWLRHALFSKKEARADFKTQKKERTAYQTEGAQCLDAAHTRRKLAQSWAEKGGAVFLPCFEKDWSITVRHAKTGEEIERGSQIPLFLAKTKTDEKEIRQLLEAGESVLFFGAQRHARDLEERLGKQYENLTIVTVFEKAGDLSDVWGQYVREIHGKKEIGHISFDWKEEQKIIVSYADGTAYKGTDKKDLLLRTVCSGLVCQTEPEHQIRRYELKRRGVIIPGESMDEKNWVIANGDPGEAITQLCKAETPLKPAGGIARLEHEICQKIREGQRAKRDQDHFKKLAQKKTLRESLELALNGKYDVGLYGPWMSNNYGSILTYHALYRTVESLGYDVLMIEKGKERYVQRDDAYNAARRFALRNGCAVSPVYDFVNQSKLNDHCETFLLGSNQVWNYGVAKGYGFGFYFDFVREERKKIAYAASFAHLSSFTPPSQYARILKLMKQFDAVSVREQGGAEILKNQFGMDGTVVLDPVFLADPAIYEEQVKKADKTVSEPFLVSYVLDPTPELNEALAELSKKTGWKVILLSDGNNRGWRKTKKVIRPETGTVMEDLQVEQWLYYLKNAQMIVTDSCQGTNFSLLFHKPMIIIGNEKRGIVRFREIVKTFGLEKRYVKKASEILGNDTLLEPVDFSKTDRIIEEKRAASMQWLKAALEAKRQSADDIRAVAKRQCCGCGACENICPTDAITMVQDQEGFFYPSIDQEKCIHCGKCLKACPSAHERNVNWETPKCYAAYTDEPVRDVSSSGGIFSLVAEEILKRGGAVCGAAFDEKFELAQTVVYDREGLAKLRGSKYLQSTSKKTYREIKRVLDQGKPALFCGCPCQVAGLYGYLGRDYEKLFTLDLMCHGGPSPMVFQKYLKEVHGGHDITYVGFRDKDYFGWSTEMTVKYADGKIYRKTRDKDLFYRAFLPCLSVRPHCQICKYSRLSRQGDMTLADFWGIQKYNPEYTDGKGTSILVVNNKKAEQMLKTIQVRLKLCEPAKIEYILTHGQPFAKPFKTYNPKRERFMELIQHTTMEKAVRDTAEDHYDVGIYGVWPGGNYGSVMTYYCLCRAIESLGYSVLMIEKPRISEKDRPYPLIHSRRFAYEHYKAVSLMYPIKELEKLNKSCDTFVIGSDQVWNYGVNQWCGNSYYFDFAEKGKRLLSYAASFGHSKSFTPAEKREEISKLLGRFTGISVREKSAVSVLKREFGAEGTQVLDPVFLPDESVMDELIGQSCTKEEEKFLLAYILDPTPEIREAIQYAAKKKNLKLISISDGIPGTFAKNKEKMNLDCVLEHVQTEEWLYYLKNCSFLITDSCHGASFAIRFHRPFLCIYNKQRGLDRFQSLAEVFGLQSRFIPRAEMILKDEKLLEDMDYSSVENIMKYERARSMEWLSSHLAMPVKAPAKAKTRGTIRKIQDKMPEGLKKKLLPLIKNTDFYKKYIKK